jgi:3-methyladenine DNA glycosylase AlkD
MGISKGLKSAQADLRRLSSRAKAKTNRWFFKTGPGQYGEGDIFLGVTVPDIRSVAIGYKALPFLDIKKLLHSKIHEERLLALFILVAQYKGADVKTQALIYKFYLQNMKWVNNWDLVDSSADKIVGDYLLKRPRSMLYRLVLSQNLWNRRVAMVATYAFIKNGEFADTLRLSQLLLNDRHDLMHKATGWMLREVGKRDPTVLENFLNKHASQMPRTMLRYSIEKFSASKRRYYLLKRFG